MDKKLLEKLKKKPKEWICYPQREDNLLPKSLPDDLGVPYIPSNPPENTKNKKKKLG